MMMKKLMLGSMLSVLSMTAFAGGMDDDPVLMKVMIDKLETRSVDGTDPLIMEADVWIGQDLNKFWFKSDVEMVDGVTEEASLEFLYSRAIDAYWDVQIGWRHDDRPAPNQEWLALGLKGLAPYFFEVDASVYLGKGGQINLSLDAEYEMMLTQKWVLSPEIEMDVYSKNDPIHEVGSGLSNIDLGLRLRYEVTREFAPYIGVNWANKFGGTADYARAAGEKTNDVQLVAGIRAWF